MDDVAQAFLKDKAQHHDDQGGGHQDLAGKAGHGLRKGQDLHAEGDDDKGFYAPDQKAGKDRGLALFAERKHDQVYDFQANDHDDQQKDSVIQIVGCDDLQEGFGRSLQLFIIFIVFQDSVCVQDIPPFGHALRFMCSGQLIKVARDSVIFSLSERCFWLLYGKRGRPSTRSFSGFEECKARKNLDQRGCEKSMA